MASGKFKFKIFTSFILFVSFLIMSFSGLILFLTPAGRIAYWTNWQFLGLTKSQWVDFHDIFSVVFIIAGIFHLFWFNWTLFWRYIKQKAVSGLNYKREFWIAAAISILLVAGTALRVPPVISIVDFSDYLTAMWEKEEDNPPIAHAERLTFRQFADTINVPLETVLETLKSKGFTPTGDDQTLEELAAVYNIAPNDIYALFKKESADQSQDTSAPQLPASGIGRMKLEELVSRLGMTMEEAGKKLDKAGTVSYTHLRAHET